MRSGKPRSQCSRKGAHVARAPVRSTGPPSSRPATGADAIVNSIRTVAVASFVGTAIEWYDFFLYGTAAALVFNRLFFPEFEPALGTVAALATFGAGSLARPLGAVLFGHVGDTRGRKSMLI